MEREVYIYVYLYRAEALDGSRSLRTSAVIRAIDASRIRTRRTIIAAQLGRNAEKLWVNSHNGSCAACVTCNTRLFILARATRTDDNNN